MAIGGIVMNKEKIKNIEFLRFLLSIILVLFHMKGFLFYPFRSIPEYQYMDIAVKNGEQVVDFFFIISGFFLIYSLKDISLISFIKNKLYRLMPTMLFVCFLYWLMSLAGYTEFNFYETFISDILMFNSTGLTISKGSMAAVWFIAILFWVSIFYFYFIKNFNQKIFLLITSLIVWFCYIMIIQSGNGSLNGNSIKIVYSFIPLGLIRGLAGIGLGCLIGNYYVNENKNNNKNNKVSIFYTSLELFLFVFLFSHMTFYHNPLKNDIIYLLTFCALLFCFLYSKGLLSYYLNNNLSVILGKYSFCIFVSHALILKLTPKIFTSDFIQNNVILTPIIILCMCSLLGVILHYTIEVPGKKQLKKFFS